MMEVKANKITDSFSICLPVDKFFVESLGLGLNDNCARRYVTIY